MRGFLRIAWPLLLAGCTRVASIDTEPMPLSPSERASVRTRVDELREKKEWKDAWNQEVQAGADRGRLERVAIAATADGADGAEEMLRELRRKHGGLTPEGRAQVDQAVQKAEAEKDYEQAAEILILTADDPPAYAAAWELYARVPPTASGDVLEVIRKAREDHEKEKAGAKEPE